MEPSQKKSPVKRFVPMTQYQHFPSLEPKKDDEQFRINLPEKTPQYPTQQETKTRVVLIRNLPMDVSRKDIEDVAG